MADTPNQTESESETDFEFKMDLPDLVRSIAFYRLDENGKNQLCFDPPVYRSRYSAVYAILSLPMWCDQIKKVVEFGCADMNLVISMRRLKNVEHIVQIDIDEELMKRFQERAAPLTWEYLDPRKTPLTILGYNGSVDSPHECLSNTDAVVCVELIEHLFPRTELNLPQNIFGSMQPKIVLFSTPNSDYNELFGSPRFDNGFRHEDHKFEWTQQQFIDWAHNICQRYPNYKVNIFGVGERPELAAETMGKCSQFACFVRKDLLGLETITVPDTDVLYPLDKYEYKQLFEYIYPMNVDNRSRTDRIMDDSKYFIHRNSNEDEQYYNSETDQFRFPIGDIYQFVQDAAGEMELHEILSKEFRIDKNNCVVVEQQNKTESEESYHDDYDGNEPTMPINNGNVLIAATDEDWD